MEEIKKNTLKNKLKNSDSGDKSLEKESKPKKEKSITEKSSKPSILENINSYFSFIQNERFQKIFGLTLLLFSVYLAIAFTSFAFSWEVDQDKVLGNLFSPEVKVENWLGKFGALISYVFIHKWFGAASYIFAFLAFITGLRITFNIGFINFRKAYAISFFLLIFISVTLGYVFSNTLFF
jgi:S-DNA-T family DNA segregation ATPase FtsK/SpoIIIE